MTLTSRKPHTGPAREHKTTSGSSDAASPNERWIEIDLSDLHLSSAMDSLDHRAELASHIYERFVPYADEGWEWVVHPASRRFDGWVTGNGPAASEIVAARLLCRRVAADTPESERSSHGLSEYRTRQLTQRLWSGAPASKAYRPVSSG
jgi:hypothetical protein